MPGSRERSIREPKTTVLIVGAGKETEPNYFRALSGEDCVRNRFAVTVKRGPGQSPIQVVESTVDLKEKKEKKSEPYDEVWCVLDVEDRQHRAPLDRALEIARENDIKVCLSNPCFEVWLLAHFVRTHKPFGDYKGVLSELNKQWRKHFAKDYEKNDEEVYRRLARWTVSDAVPNAKWVIEKHRGPSRHIADCDSSTDVYRLVEFLMSLQEQEPRTP